MGLSRRVVLVSAAGFLSGCSAGATDTTERETPRTTATATPTPAPEPEQLSLREMEKNWHHRENDYRTERGLHRFEWDRRLADIARAHSRDMLARDYYDHVGPDGAGPWERLQNASYSYEAAGENLAAARGAWDASQEDVMDHMFGSIIDSPAHHKNVVSEEYTNHGVGVAAEILDGELLVRLTDLFSLPEV